MSLRVHLWLKNRLKANEIAKIQPNPIESNQFFDQALEVAVVALRELRRVADRLDVDLIAPAGSASLYELPTFGRNADW